MDKRVDTYKERLEQLQSARSSFNAQWDEVSKVVRPAAASFCSPFNTTGKKQDGMLMDGVGQHSNELLAAGFYSLLTNPSTQWFDLATSDPALNSQRAVQIWLREVARIMFFEIQRPQTGFTTSLHELYLDHGAYGNGVMFITESPDLSSLAFMALPLQESYFIENDRGQVVSLYRHYTRTVAQLVERFGMEGVHEAVAQAFANNRRNETVQVLHVIEPNASRGLTDRSIHKEYSSLYMDLTNGHFMHQSGFDEKPFMAVRFYKSTNEIYGRGPGSSALADLKMLQEILKTTLRGAQKVVDPPLMAPDQGYLSNIRVNPGGVTYFRRGLSQDDRLQPLITGGRPELGEQLAAGIRQRVQEIFYVDQLQLNQGPQMTATEVLQRTEEKMRLMGPVVGRAQTELLGPCIQRVFGLLSRAGRLPSPPQELIESGAKLQIVYTSPFAKSQDQTEANGLLRVQQMITPFVSVDPTVMDVFDTEAIARGLGEMYAINPKYFRTQEDVQALRQQRANAQQQQEMMQQLEMLKTGSEGVAALAKGSAMVG